MIEAAYDLNGVAFIARVKTAAAAAAFDRVFGAFRCDHGRGFVVTVDEDAAPPAGLTQIWSGTLPEGTAATMAIDDERTTLAVEGDGLLAFDPDASAATLSGPADGLARLFGTPLMVLADLMLDTAGRHLVHAACLVDGSGGAVLLCAPSGTGKTTTAMALARAGFGLVTDDAAVIAFEGGRPEAWGFPRRLKVHRNTAQMLPWLGPFGPDWDANGEQGLGLDDFAGLAAVAPPRPRPLSAVILLDRPNDEAHRLVPAPKAEVLFGIAADNVPWFARGVPARGQRLFAALSRAIAAVPAYRLSVGPDPGSLGDHVADRLGRPAAGG